MFFKKLFPLCLAATTFYSCSLFKKNSTAGNQPQKVVVVKTDSSQVKIKPYKDVITPSAITRNGMIRVHQVDQRYYFEIPRTLLGRDLLMITRISKAAAGTFYYGADQVGEWVFQFSWERGDKIFLKSQYFIRRTVDTTENSLSAALASSSLLPILAAFNVMAISPDSAAVVDVTDFFNGSSDMVTTSRQFKDLTNLMAGYQPDKSYIESIRPFPENLEIKTVKTFTAPIGAPYNTFEFNYSFVQLPEHPMRPRFEDKRVGYFGVGYQNFNASQPVMANWMITRWRLEPKDNEVEKYLRGELVEPKKPIVYYIDPATPKKWIPYLKQGIMDWQVAFEQAGFKNAIYALDAPVNDTNWSLEDARHSAIVYKASDFQNAAGPHVSDPRTGEILETHIEWFHNVQQLIHDWYMVQAGPNDPGARKMQFDDTLMGKLIRFVCAHEVGHTLGLQHNFVSSSTVPVDSLRSKRYVKENGICPSIMDYARFNYVAQPEDEMDPDDLIPRIGVYDKWAIEWGYRWMQPSATPEDEKNYLSQWVTSQIQKDPRLTFGKQTPPDFNFDPTRQSEDLGDDPVKASYYGVQNLKRVYANLQDWTYVAGEDYNRMKGLRNEAFTQFNRYLNHVSTIIGGIIWTQKYRGQEGLSLRFPKRQQQKDAVKFLVENLFSLPKWLFDNNVYSLAASDPGVELGPGRINYVNRLLGKFLFRITSNAVYNNLLMAEDTQPGDNYSIDELLSDLETGIWGELNLKQPISTYRRSLQKLYVERLISQIDVNTKWQYANDKILLPDIYFTDAHPIVKDHLRKILHQIDLALPKYKDRLTLLHLKDVKDRIKKALYQQPNISPSNSNPVKEKAETEFTPSVKMRSLFQTEPMYNPHCWPQGSNQN